MFASTGSGTADSLGEPPAFPVGDAAGEVAETGAAHVHLQDLGGVGDQEVTDPLGEAGTARGHGMLDVERTEECSPLRIREPDEKALAAGMSEPRSTERRH